MYLQDAQNLFNENAKFGNWEIDKKLAVMAEYKIGKIIIIAIEHAEEDRIKEYNVGKTVLGKGQGKKYIRFVTETLKPFVEIVKQNVNPKQEGIYYITEDKSEYLKDLGAYADGACPPFGHV